MLGPVMVNRHLHGIGKQLEFEMATRQPQKAKRAATSKKAQPTELKSAMQRLETKVKQLQAERDQLKSDLKVAKARIGELEAQQTEAVNRIDWVIDSLHNLIEDKG